MRMRLSGKPFVSVKEMSPVSASWSASFALCPNLKRSGCVSEYYHTDMNCLILWLIESLLSGPPVGGILWIESLRRVILLRFHGPK